MPLNVGTRLGPYEMLSSLGAGGMGEVYRACDTPDIVEEFRRVASWASSLQSFEYIQAGDCAVTGVDVGPSVTDRDHFDLP